MHLRADKLWSMAGFWHLTPELVASKAIDRAGSTAVLYYRFPLTPKGNLNI